MRLTRSRLAERYRSSLLGPLWLFLVPLLLLAVYTFVFARVFEARWGAAGVGRGAVRARPVLWTHAVWADCRVPLRGAGLLPAYQSHLKQLVFPSEILAWVCLLTCGVRLCASLALLLIAYLITVGPLPFSAVAAPVTLVPIALLSLGCDLAVRFARRLRA